MSANLNLIYSEFNLNVANDYERIIYAFEDYRLDGSRRMLYRGEEVIPLVPKAVETLLALIERRGEIVSKGELIETIWTDTIVDESNLQHYLHVLRKTLGTQRDGKPFIETFRRRGYRFTAEVRLINDNPKIAPADSVPVAEPEILPVNWAGDKPAYSGGNPSNGESSVTFKPPDNFRHRQMILAAAVFMFFFSLATILYFQFQPVKTSSHAAVIGEVSVTPLTNGYVVLSAAVSPDGKYFVYHDGDGDIDHLWLQQIGQPARIEIIPTGARSIAGKTFSPNGEFVYFTSLEKGETKYALYRVPTLGGTPTKIIDDTAASVSFSADGREMAFVRYDEKAKQFQIVTAPVDGGKERIVLTSGGAENYFSSAAWSPDGKYIAFGSLVKNSPSGEGNCSLAAVEVQTGAVKNLSPEKWDSCFRMIWTPDGEGIVFIGTRAGETYTTRRDQVYFLSTATGQSRRLTSDGSRYQDQSLGITADNSIIAVPSKRLSQIWALDADGDSRTAVQLTNGQADGRAGIAPLPDGRVGYISRVGENLSVWIMNADGSNQRQINNQIPYIEELRATPDGRYFIFSARRDGYSHLYRMDTDGANLKQLIGGASYEIDSTVSPDSRWVYYGSRTFEAENWKSDLRKINIETGETMVLREWDKSDLVPHISPDGKSISTFADNKIKIFSASDGALLNLLEAPAQSNMQSGAKWTPDGHALTYQVYSDNSVNLWQQAFDKTPPRPLTNFSKGYVYFHAYSNDGRRLYVARGYHLRDAVLISNWR